MVKGERVGEKVSKREMEDRERSSRVEDLGGSSGVGRREMEGIDESVGGGWGWGGEMGETVRDLSEWKACFDLLA